MTPTPEHRLLEEAAQDLYAGGPYGEFIGFLDHGARAICDAHTMEVYRGLVAGVAHHIAEAVRHKPMEFRGEGRDRIGVVPGRDEIADFIRDEFSGASR